jgi:uncharacterized protein (TIGR02246 family)
MSSAAHDEHAIRGVIQTWMFATQTGDIDAVLDLMTDDAVFLTVGKEPFGKEEFKKAAEVAKSGEPGGVIYDGKSDIKEIKILGDWAFVRANLTIITHPSRGGTPTRRSGYALSIFRRESDGKWRLARDANLLAEEIK